ncbi:hypothetical protein C8Q80DRAFT_1125371 [Daedaleopsis nitida]|nr:hypothetical protein C8Q80DRAFT_1125371 [Daedaleopsis nitida]
MCSCSCGSSYTWSKPSTSRAGDTYQWPAPAMLDRATLVLLPLRPNVRSWDFRSALEVGSRLRSVARDSARGESGRAQPRLRPGRPCDRSATKTVARSAGTAVAAAGWRIRLSDQLGLRSVQHFTAYRYFRLKILVVDVQQQCRILHTLTLACYRSADVRPTLELFRVARIIERPDMLPPALTALSIDLKARIGSVRFAQYLSETDLLIAPTWNHVDRVFAAMTLRPAEHWHDDWTDFSDKLLTIACTSLHTATVIIIIAHREGWKTVTDVMSS